MAGVTLRADGSVCPPDVDLLARIPRRVRLTRTDLDRILRLTGTPAPWPDAPGPAAPPKPPQPTEPPERGDPPALPELTGAWLLTPLGDVAPEAAAALAVFGAPEALVDLDLSVRRAEAPAGFVQVRSWQRFAAGRVTTLATAGGDFELGWFGADRWPAELARAVTVPAAAPGARCPAAGLDLPHELLLGTGEALRRHREDLFAELARRHTGTVRAADRPTPLGLPETAEQVRLLHLSVRGRLQAVVSGVGTTGARKAGWVSWLLFPDGWRALTPHVEDGVPRVRVHPVAPARLGVEVARLVTAVRG